MTGDLTLRLGATVPEKMSLMASVLLAEMLAEDPTIVRTETMMVPPGADALETLRSIAPLSMVWDYIRDHPSCWVVAVVGESG
jgi:hypothetical protein